MRCRAARTRRRPRPLGLDDDGAHGLLVGRRHVGGAREDLAAGHHGHLWSSSMPEAMQEVHRQTARSACKIHAVPGCASSAAADGLAGVSATSRRRLGRQEPHWVPQRFSACSCARRSAGLPVQRASVETMASSRTSKQLRTPARWRSAAGLAAGCRASNQRPMGGGRAGAPEIGEPGAFVVLPHAQQGLDRGGRHVAPHADAAGAGGPARHRHSAGRPCRPSRLLRRLTTSGLGVSAQAASKLRPAQPLGAPGTGRHSANAKPGSRLRSAARSAAASAAGTQAQALNRHGRLADLTLTALNLSSGWRESGRWPGGEGH